MRQTAMDYNTAIHFLKLFHHHSNATNNQDRQLQWTPFEIQTIRCKMYEFYEKKEHLKITKLLKTLRDEGIFNGWRTLLY
uniref:Uncharacterized protein n=1 Tax=Amphimedon queenslandica TaxID=400682 RepID=A0A1X7V6C1_AMPQE